MRRTSNKNDRIKKRTSAKKTGSEISYQKNGGATPIFCVSVVFGGMNNLRVKETRRGNDIRKLERCRCMGSRWNIHLSFASKKAVAIR